MKTTYNLGDTLISFAVSMIKLAEKLPKNLAGNHLAGQLTRSGTSPALHYGEAQSSLQNPDRILFIK